MCLFPETLISSFSDVHLKSTSKCTLRTGGCQIKATVCVPVCISFFKCGDNQFYMWNWGLQEVGVYWKLVVAKRRHCVCAIVCPFLQTLRSFSYVNFRLTTSRCTLKTGGCQIKASVVPRHCTYYSTKRDWFGLGGAKSTVCSPLLVRYGTMEMTAIIIIIIVLLWLTFLGRSHPDFQWPKTAHWEVKKE